MHSCVVETAKSNIERDICLLILMQSTCDFTCTGPFFTLEQLDFETFVGSYYQPVKTTCSHG